MHQVVLWVFIAFLLAGGLIGFFKGRSAVSLITSSIAAAILIIIWVPGFMHRRTAAGFTDVVMAVLLVVFAVRLAKTKKFMPGGMLVIVTALALLCLHLWP